MPHSQPNHDPLDVEFQFCTLTGGLNALAHLIGTSTDRPPGAELGSLVQIVADNAKALQERVINPG